MSDQSTLDTAVAAVAAAEQEIVAAFAQEIANLISVIKAAPTAPAGSLDFGALNNLVTIATQDAASAKSIAAGGPLPTTLPAPISGNIPH